MIGTPGDEDFFTFQGEAGLWLIIDAIPVDSARTSPAEVVVLSGSPPEAFFLSYLPAGDVDYLAFDLAQAVAISAFCAASSYGSGVVGLHAEIRDASDAMLSGGDEQFGGVSLDANLPAAGRYYVRLNAAGQDPVVTGNFVRCFIQIPSL